MTFGGSQVTVLGLIPDGMTDDSFFWFRDSHIVHILLYALFYICEPSR